MKISILTPCKNSEHYIEETIESVLNQTAIVKGIVKLEYIIIDGLSTDRTLNNIKKYRNKIQIISEKDNGLYDALSKGIERVTGDFIGYINAGDYYHKCAFEIIDDIYKNKKKKWITGYAIGYNKKSYLLNVRLPFRYRKKFMQCGFYDNKRLPHVQQESTFWHSSLNSAINLKKLKTFKLAGDYYLWNQFSRIEELTIVQAYLGGFKRHGGQLSENLLSYNREYKSIIAQESNIIDLGLMTFDKIIWEMPNLIKKIFNKSHLIKYNMNKNQWE